MKNITKILNKKDRYNTSVKFYLSMLLLLIVLQSLHIFEWWKMKNEKDSQISKIRKKLHEITISELEILLNQYVKEVLKKPSKSISYEILDAGKRLRIDFGNNNVFNMSFKSKKELHDYLVNEIATSKQDSFDF